MSSPVLVPMYDPEGTLRDVPFDQVKSAVAAGGVPAHPVQAPDGSTRMIPVTRLKEAAQNGGKILPLSSEDPHLPAAYGFTLSNLAKNAWEGVKGTAQGAYALGKDVATNPNWFMGKDSTFNKFVLDPAGAEAQKASDAWKEGRYSEAFGHELAGIVPVVGPAAAEIGTQAGSGDVGGALAKGTAEVVTPVVAAKGAGALVRAAAPAAQALSERMYQSSLKPSPASYSTAEVGNMVRTGLDAKIPVSEAGIDKLHGLISDLNTKIKTEIDAGAQRGVTVDPNEVAKRADQVKGRFTNQVNPEADLSAIDASKEEFLRRAGWKAGKPAQAPQPTGVLDANGNPVMTPGAPATPATPAKPMPASEAQSLKQGTYAQLKGRSYGELRSATIEAQKALARGLKEEIAKQFPEVAQMNAQESKFIGLDDALERAVRRMDNGQMMKLGGTLAGGATKAATGSSPLGLATFALKTVIDDPILKSKLAIALNRAGKGATSVADANARVAAYSAALSAGAQAAAGPSSGQ